MSNDRAHFDDYLEQTRIKHCILEKYLPAFFQVLKGANKNLLYIDGFAGRGTYTDADGAEVPGSPLRALQTIVDTPGLHERVAAIFFERDEALAVPLRARVEEFHEAHPEIRRPRVVNAEFAPAMNDLLERLDGRGSRIAPTFLLVDPCGVKGASFATISRFLSSKSTEAFIFFNITGIGRILGLGDGMGDTLRELLGGKERATELLRRVAVATDLQSKEKIIVGYYRELLIEHAGTPYVAPFRVEARNRKTSSHYLIHASSHATGFRIMKDVMWSVGQRADGAGGLVFEQASRSPNLVSLFDFHLQEIKVSVLRELEKVGPVKVSHFSVTLVERPEDQIASKGYKQALLALEGEGKVEVLEKDGSGNLAGRRRAGTLGDEYYVRVSG